MFAIYFVYSFEGWVLEHWTPDAPEHVQELNARIKEDFPSVARSMLSLGEAISGGRDWHEFYVIFAASGSVDSAVFLAMMTFFQIAVWNIVASVFIESTLMCATADREQQALAQRRRDEKDAKEFMALCRTADLDGSGTMSLDEFHALMENDQVHDFFKAKHLDVKDATYFFKMVEAMNDGKEIELEDFVAVCLRVKGGATSIDLQTLAVEHKMLAQKTKKFMPVVQDALAGLERKIDGLLVAMSSSSSPAQGDENQGLKNLVLATSLLQHDTGAQRRAVILSDGYGNKRRPPVEPAAQFLMTQEMRPHVQAETFDKSKESL
eukprot:TRINITY_DN2867_c1_g1_i2.p1 TRINITY_DN2867_c1_g1~~TRINITY_DN2867_c1_g1_i2.p1  ORF type:complete len:322 (-),score=75.06 TRINITY_DN2867_c1_g1_i2:118-1083(-)